MTDMSRLEEQLSATAEAIDWPAPSADLAARVKADIESQPTATGLRIPRLAVATVILLALVAVIILSPTTRQAIADLFSAGGVQIGVTAEPEPAPGAGLSLGVQVDLDDAVREVDFLVRAPAGPDPGPPEAFYVQDGQLTMVWSGTPALPAAGGTDVALLLTQSRADQGLSLATKLVSPETEVVELFVEGSRAVWIEGAPHTFTLHDEEGVPFAQSARLAANVLLWESSGVNYRLETTGDLESALALVDSLDPLR